MKLTAQIIPSLLVSIFLASSLSATPDPSTSAVDEVFGSNAEGHAILTRVVENRGSYYDWYEETILTEFTETGAKKTVLLHEHVSFPDADTRKPLERRLLKKDAKVKLADLLEKYPRGFPKRWDQERMKRLTRDKQGRVIFDEALPILEKSDLEKVSRIKRDDHLLVGAMTDNHDHLLLHFEISREGDEGDAESRWIAVPSKLSTQVMAWLRREESYYMLESFDTLEAVKKSVKELPNETWHAARGADLQIWSRKSESGKLTYVIVVPLSLKQGWENVTGVEMTRIKGTSLWEKL